MDNTATTRISVIAHDFTQQAGSALGAVEARGTQLRLTQSRFFVEYSESLSTRWHVPVVSQAVGSSAALRDILTLKEPLDVPGGADVVVNAGQAGYFRTLYMPGLMQNLVAHFRGLSPADELGLVNDSTALGYSGHEPLSRFSGNHSTNHRRLGPRGVARRRQSPGGNGLFVQGSARAGAVSRVRPSGYWAGSGSYGLEARADETQNVTLLRSDLLDALSEFNDPEVIARARSYFSSYLKDPSVLAVDLRHSVLAIVPCTPTRQPGINCTRWHNRPPAPSRSRTYTPC